MKDVYETKQFIFIIMECVEGGELFEHVKNYIIQEREASLIIY